MAHSRSFARALLVAGLLLSVLAAAIVPTLTAVEAAPVRQGPATDTPTDTPTSTATSTSTSTGTPTPTPTSTPTNTPTPTVPPALEYPVISQFRTRGPGSVSDEFVEIFNATSGNLSLAGWTLRASSACNAQNFLVYSFGSASTVTLAPGQYYLISGTAYSGPTAPDVPNVNLNLEDQGGIALVNPSNVAVDKVGLCSQTAYVELPALAPITSSSDQSYERLPGDSRGSCIDTNRNANDFVLINPSAPRNSGSPFAPCVPRPTPTPTNTPTATATIPPNCALTPTPSVAYPALTAVINEVGWSGTFASSSDYWVELYNPGGCPLPLGGWSLQGWYYNQSNSPLFNIAFDSTNEIPPGGFLVLASKSDIFSANVNFLTVSSLNFQYTYGESLHLFGPHSEQIDTANVLSSYWPAGLSSGRASMERYNAAVGDIAANWVTWAGSTTKGPSSPLDRNGNVVRGTPGRPNWTLGVTLTPSPVATRYKTPTARPPTPFAHMVINEFLPRAGTDWNGDGSVDVYDEFVELKNLGPIDVNLQGWKIDVLSSGPSTSFNLPSLTLHTGDRVLYYGSQDGLRLPDSGGTVRLFNNRGVLIDARSYGPVADPDISHCRIPDGYYWQVACFPTPGLENALTGTPPAPPPSAALLHPPPCLLADTVPQPFRDAECSPHGADVFNPAYWDDQAGHGQFPVQDVYYKWKTWVQ